MSDEGGLRGRIAGFVVEIGETQIALTTCSQARMTSSNTAFGLIVAIAVVPLVST